MRVVVTGAAGRLARAVLPALCAKDDVARVLAVDQQAIAYAHPKLVPVPADIADVRAHAALHDADALVNLAFVVLRGRMPLAAMRATNVDATKSLLEGARERGVTRIVHLSSAAVYGSGRGLADDAPLAPLARFHYARHKAEVDAWIAQALPHATVLRPTIVLGPNALPLLALLLDLPLYVRVQDPQPQLSLVHEDDVAQAVVRALDARAPGPFNLAARGTFALRDLIRARHRHALGMPPALARIALEASWRVSGFGGEPGWIDGATASLTLDCTRARRVLGWRPRYEDCESIVATCARRRLLRRTVASVAPGAQKSE